MESRSPNTDIDSCGEDPVLIENLTLRQSCGAKPHIVRNGMAPIPSAGEEATNAGPAKHHPARKSIPRVIRPEEQLLYSVRVYIGWQH
jgi:hypothetical protein